MYQKRLIKRSIINAEDRTCNVQVNTATGEYMMESKKLALLRILEILKDESDVGHPLKQEDIAKKLADFYGIEIERKAIGRNISLLREAGYEIENTRQGCYLDEREFEDSELRLLIDGVLSSRHINAKHSKDLIVKLCRLSNIYFRSHVKNIYTVNDWNKTDNMSLFYNIEVVDSAIEKGRVISFNYNKYGIDKKLHLSSFHKVSPYQLILHNQHYYLMARQEKWENINFYRLDRITDIKITDKPLTDIRKVKGYENGINYKDISAGMPYMFTDKPETVAVSCEEWMADQIIDWFGFDVRFESKGDGKIVATFKTSKKAMLYWAMQYACYVEVLSPVSLREEIIDCLRYSINKYDKEIKK